MSAASSITGPATPEEAAAAIAAVLARRADATGASEPGGTGIVRWRRERIDALRRSPRPH